MGGGGYNLDGHTVLVETFIRDQASGIDCNDGKDNFDDVTTPPGLNRETRCTCFGAGLVDFDNHGGMDALIMNVNEPPSLVRNDASSGNYWIKIRLEGLKSNRSAIGARVLAHFGGKAQT